MSKNLTGEYLARNDGASKGGKKQQKQDKCRRVLPFMKHKDGKGNTSRHGWRIMLFIQSAQD
ncbi:MAG: hypothetical protein IKO41_14750 [Lachnospiraceae bacterium]|nr:hypothetical protein [Lachnospiraceae bacterium]